MPKDSLYPAASDVTKPEDVSPAPDQHESTTAPSESTGGSSPETVETADGRTVLPADAPEDTSDRPDVDLKLNPDKGLDSPAWVTVPNFEEIQLSDSAVPVKWAHAQLLLTTDVVVAD